MPTPDFILDLRRRIGTELLWLSGVTGVVLDEGGQVLLGRRSDNGLWALPSGILEPGEEPAMGLLREITEETAIIAEALALTHVSVGPPTSYPNGDRTQFLDLTFWCRPLSGEAQVADEESTEVGWFALGDLPAPLAPSSAERLAATLRYRHDPGAGASFAGRAETGD
ncbi:NUDIX hydrolase [Bogoriella caseilytica]|nr:NUDIX domain-containing protein [Bogoriella caseilytica]